METGVALHIGQCKQIGNQNIMKQAVKQAENL